jgi:hypothetical protein
VVELGTGWTVVDVRKRTTRLGVGLNRVDDKTDCPLDDPATGLCLGIRCSPGCGEALDSTIPVPAAGGSTPSVEVVVACARSPRNTATAIAGRINMSGLKLRPRPPPRAAGPGSGTGSGRAAAAGAGAGKIGATAAGAGKIGAIPSKFCANTGLEPTSNASANPTQKESQRSLGALRIKAPSSARQFTSPTGIVAT